MRLKKVMLSCAGSPNYPGPLDTDYRSSSPYHWNYC